MILGVHCAVIRGFAAALAEAEALGCAAMQMLPYRRHRAPTDEEFVEFRRAMSKTAIKRLLAHSRFVPSLASSDEERRRRSVELLAQELRWSRALGAEAFVLHAGAYSAGGDAKEGVRLAVGSIIEAAARSEAKLPVVLENVPGGGRRLGGTLEELAALLEELSRRLPDSGVCLDTAHAWAAGYDLASAEGTLKFLSRVNRLLGAERVRAFHLNDTRALLGSHRESHEHWGDGFLGREGVRTLLQRPEYADALGILETPKRRGSDERDLAFLRALA